MFVPIIFVGVALNYRVVGDTYFSNLDYANDNAKLYQ